MASALMSSIRTISGNQPVMRRLSEKAGQVFLAGTPVQLSAAVVQEFDGTPANGIVGITSEPGANLAVAGVPQLQSYGSVQFEPLASNVAVGTPNNDGRNAVELGSQDTVFFAQVGPAQTRAATDVGVAYGMTKDSDGHWYVDRTKTGANAVCTVVKLDPFDVRGVHIVILAAVAQLPA